MVRNGAVRAYSSPQTRHFENSLASLIRPHCPVEPYTQPLKLTCEFHVTPPKRMVRPIPSVKPDLDNYLKGVMDAFNEAMWHDDGQVVEVVAKKVYHTGQAKIIIKIEEV